MEIFEQEQILKTFEILVDTREQPTKRSRERYEAFGCQYRRNALNYGDYTYSANFGGKPLFKEGTVSGFCVVERKMNLDELASCFGSGRARFQREFERAVEHKAKIYLLIEDASWEKLLGGKYESRFNPAALTASLIAWSVRYNITPIMCDRKSSGKLIKEILYRDFKERLERGEFDERLD